VEPTSQPASDPRLARGDEADALAELWLRSRRASMPAIPPPVHSDDEVRSYFASVHLVRHEVWTIADDDAPVALMVLDGPWLDQLYVDPDHTGRGLGTQLLALAKRRRPGGLDLWTFESNVGARRFYERHGFVAVEATDGDNEEGAPDVHYRWTPDGATYGTLRRD